MYNIRTSLTTKYKYYIITLHSLHNYYKKFKLIDTGKSSALTVNVYELRKYGKGKSKGELYPRVGHKNREME
jgi:hypothetical protein